VDVLFAGPDGASQERPAFWDGGKIWKVRFAPDAVGDWTWRARCAADAGLDGQLGAFTCTPYQGDNPFYRHGPLQVAANGRYLVHHDGTPYFWLVDTAWNGALKSAAADWQTYLADRARKHFTGIQYVVTQWRAAEQNAEGQVAYTGFDAIRIQPEFFRRIDERTRAVNEHGLLAVPVLLWTLGEAEENPGQLPEDQAILLARYLTARLGAWHTAWFLPGDGNYTGANADRWIRIGRAVFDRPGHAPVTLHPGGMQWPWERFRTEPWVSFFGYQSGHGDDENTLRWIFDGPPALQWAQTPVRPVINLEPPYEDHVAYQSRQPHTAYAVRRAVYWSLLNAPTAGSSYGAHGVWSWETAPAVPKDHGGSGIAKPWHEAMALPGSIHMQYMAELFTSLPWWTLEPDQDLLAQESAPTPAPARTHLVYTRNTNGQTALYVNGKEQARNTIDGTLANWDPDYRLCLANELTRDRPWLGTLHRIALFDRALTADEAGRLFAAGPDAAPPNPLALYGFQEGEGTAVHDTAGQDSPVTLAIDPPAAVRWLPDGGLEVREPALIASAAPATRLTQRIANAGQLTVEAWVTPANFAQAGPARIASLSRDTGARNLTLGQEAAAYQVRCRTTGTSDNGLPGIASAEPQSAAHHVAASRSPDGSLAVIYVPTGGPIAITPGRLRDGLAATWFNPRTGESSPAPPPFHAPDTNDWALVLQPQPAR
jgi:hypothetical protein